MTTRLLLSFLPLLETLKFAQDCKIANGSCYHIEHIQLFQLSKITIGMFIWAVASSTDTKIEGETDDASSRTVASPKAAHRTNMPRRPLLGWNSNNNNNNTYSGGNVYGPNYGNNGSPWGSTLANNPLQLWQPPARNNLSWPPYSYPPARRIQHPPMLQSPPTFNIPVPVPYPQYFSIPTLMPDPYWYDDDDEYWDTGCSGSTIISHQCHHTGGRR